MFLEGTLFALVQKETKRHSTILLPPYVHTHTAGDPIYPKSQCALPVGTAKCFLKTSTALLRSEQGELLTKATSRSLEVQQSCGETLLSKTAWETKAADRHELPARVLAGIRRIPRNIASELKRPQPVNELFPVFPYVTSMEILGCEVVRHEPGSHSDFRFPLFA